jgi:hypothetical protein
MKREDLIEYLQQMKARYPGLSSRQMSIEAELAENAVASILAGRTNPTPYTIKKLTDKWGTPEDYVVLMRLAGHLPPEPDGDLDITADELQVINLLREAKGKPKVSSGAFVPSGPDDQMARLFWSIWEGLSTEDRAEVIRLMESKKEERERMGLIE